MVMVRVEDLTKVVVGREQESLFGLRALRCIGNAVTSVTPVEPPHHRSAPTGATGHTDSHRVKGPVLRSYGIQP